jgi:hypothetical protein
MLDQIKVTGGDPADFGQLRLPKTQIDPALADTASCQGGTWQWKTPWLSMGFCEGSKINLQVFRHLCLCVYKIPSCFKGFVA